VLYLLDFFHYESNVKGARNILDAKEKCLFINSITPKGGLFTGKKEEIHPDCNTSWHISPEPFWILPEELEWFEELGKHLYTFYRACNTLYSQSYRGIQPTWVSEYLDKGKPEDIISYGRINRFKSHLPMVIRPDIIPTEDGMIITELDSVPGGMGFTANLAQQYAQLDHDIVGCANGMIRGFAEMMRSLAKNEMPNIAIVVSDEAADYWDEMVWLSGELRKSCLPAYTVKPHEVIFTEDGLWLEIEGNQIQIDVVYRFFELFDLKNIPKTELIMYSAKKRNAVVTPPFKAQLEEKLLLSLLHHPVLKTFWLKEIGEDTYNFLQAITPKSWILDPRELPPHAVIPDLYIGGSPVNDWNQLVNASQRERELVIKPSGFSELAWGSHGVSIGHDIPSTEWGEAVENALASFEQTPYILQEFHKGKTFLMEYYDFHTDKIVRVNGRARLCPYYFVVNNKPRLSGILATICPPDKKILHGMVDAIMVPCAVLSN